MNELSLIKLNPETHSTKQKIIDLLSNEWPLSAKQIHEKLQKLYALEISYQAVHKTLKEMEEEKTIENKKGYQLNIEWIQKTKKIFENTEKRYLEKGKIQIPKDFNGSIEIEFDNYTTFCVSMAELLLSRQLAKPEEKDAICTLEYGWFPFKINVQHFKLLAEMMLANPGSKNIIRTKTPFGEWIKKQYNKINAISAPIGTKIDIEEDLFIQGDHLIEVKFDEKTKRLIEKYYKKWKNLEDNFKEFGLKPEPKIKITVKITKNPEMAKYFRKQMEKVFEGK